MNTLVEILIIIHATFGSLALVSGPGAILTRKGGKMHRRFGKIFYYSLIIASCLALIISNLPGHKNLFLFTIGIFSLYMVLSGRRFLSLKMLYKDQKASTFDWVLAIVMLISGIVMVVYGIMLAFTTAIGYVLILFGALSLQMVIASIRLFLRKNVKPNSWLLEHIGRMLGANIATFTAFLVVNNRILPPLVAWLLPTVVFVPIITYFSAKERKKNKA